MMKKWTQGLLVTITVVALGWSLLSTLYTRSLSEELTELKRESHSDVIYLRCRLRELESDLLASLLDRIVTPTEPVGGAPAESESTESITDDETETDTEGETTETTEAATQPETTTDSDDETEAVTESVTLPTHESPETRPVQETDAPSAVYILGVHEGRIGLFDAAGELLETVNVFVMTLPAADRAALEVGIPVSSPEEARELLEKYE